ncbi:unnamed protein product [Acanthoscelides obtectus]|uniref:Uncharacterized protein n=1 Tax=Acanthoscelides obtectus TaxID=200917 RepID=A0A9P0LX31_ACAOB|nr:unnamed protein product [Acanthoscelides obtectus]CAK1641610.1 hypothetical protein AOBTE_LOCUS12505 [Acanthoscelides obtectus]
MEKFTDKITINKANVVLVIIERCFGQIEKPVSYSTVFLPRKVGKCAENNYCLYCTP